MQVHDLLDAAPPSQPAPVYLFGPGKSNPRARESTFEPYLAERAVKRLIEAYVDPDNRDFAFSSFHGDEISAEHVVGEAQTRPFLAERRVILVRNVERFAAETTGGTLTSYLEDPSEFTVLLLIANKLDKRTKFFKACEKSGTIVECPMLDQRTAIAWVRTEAKARGVNVDANAASELVGRTGTHLSDVNNALTLVIDFIGADANQISEGDVIAACADVAEEQIWTLTDAIAGSNTGLAVEALRNLTDLGKHPDEIVGTINWLLKSAYQVCDPTLSASVSRFVANKVRPLADKLGSRKLEDGFVLCTDTQFMMRETGVDAALALDLLVVKLSMPRGRR